LSVILRSSQGGKGRSGHAGEWFHARALQSFFFERPGTNTENQPYYMSKSGGRFDALEFFEIPLGQM
jgi:hypothetical protein